MDWKCLDRQVDECSGRALRGMTSYQRAAHHLGANVMHVLPQERRREPATSQSGSHNEIAGEILIELSSAGNNKVSFAPLNENKVVRNVAMKECVTSSKRKIIALEPGTLRAREYSDVRPIPK